MSLQLIKQQISSKASLVKAKQMMKFFKTGPGQYAQGDQFLGLSNPQCRQIAKNNKKTATLIDIETLLVGKFHQQRFIALLLMQQTFKAKQQNQQIIYNMYIKNIKFINNWDLVDLSAPNIIGKYLIKRCDHFNQIQKQGDPRKILYQLVLSPLIWQRRISILSTFTFIRSNQFYDTIKLAKALLFDKQDLIHKGVGWMLRQVGKREERILQNFIQQNYEIMPRTTLRYAIQKFQEVKRKAYLQGKL